ncbi:MAG TPA: bacteriohemerythrin [Anaeromyxobacteraceae bacterium]|nr:bacteriohemerythrin [Anaeromyxobacteraceae bacterium]
MALPWDPSLAVGLPEIDGQHQELFARIDRLIVAIQAGRSGAEVVRLLDYLSRYAVEHFAAEERLMEERQYPEREAHRAEHRRFEEDLAGLRVELARDGPGALLVVRVNTRVALWLRDHIYRTDKALVAFLTDRYLSYTRS